MTETSLVADRLDTTAVSPIGGQRIPGYNPRLGERYDHAALDTHKGETSMLDRVYSVLVRAVEMNCLPLPVQRSSAWLRTDWYLME
jgi:hypothetical protein